MSGAGSPPVDLPPLPANGSGVRSPVAGKASSSRRYWLHLLLLALTLLTTTAAGALLAWDFERNMPISAEEFIEHFPLILSHPSALVAGLPFSLTLLGILLAHELGHYLTCVFHRVEASLPYFIPAPTLVGTFGAFIRVRSPILSKPALFDVGIAGPLAGFLLLLPVLAIGLAYSKIIPGIAARGEVIFGAPLLQRGLETLILPGVPSGDIYLHPVARAAWVGLLATALNLLPIGQLDGGHILYAYVGEWHRGLTSLFIAALIPLGFFFSYTWLIWAALLFLFGRRHPTLYDPTPLNRSRRLLGAVALVILLLSFSLTPVRLSDA